MRRISSLTFVVVFLLAGFAHADPPENYPFVTFDAGMQQAQDEGKPMFLYFGRYGCGYCDKTNQEAFSDPEVRDRYTENYVLVYVDAESGKRLTLPSGERITERDLGAHYNAFVTPVFVFAEPDGAQLAKAIGVQRKIDLLDMDKAVMEALAK